MSDKPPEIPDRTRPDLEENLVVQERRRTRRPKRYRVILHNDDYTSMEFVIHVLIKYFHKSETEANHIMLEVHHKGRGIAGVYTFDEAETKVHQVMSEAREAGMPLQLTLERE